MLDLVAIAVTVDARKPAVDHITDARHGERGFRHIGGEHDAASAGGLEHALLLFKRQPCVERQNFCALRMMLAQQFGGVTDLTFTRQENQNVAAGAFAREFVNRIEDGLPRLLFFVFVEFRRVVAHLHRIKSAADLNHRCGRAAAGEVFGKASGIDSGRGHDQFEIGALRQHPSEIAEQKVNVEAALMRLVDDQRVIGLQQPVALRLGEQYAVGHHLDISVARDLVGKTHLVADRMAQRCIEFGRHACGYRARSDTPRLRVTDQTRDAAL